ncbi:MAG: EAL domain-containing protein [Gammaproteobacteria bacterium]
MPSDHTLRDYPHFAPATSRSALRQLQSALRDNRLELFFRALRETATGGNTVLTGCELCIGLRDADGTLSCGAELDTLIERYQMGLEVNRRAIEMAAAALRDARSPLAGFDLALLPLPQQALADRTMPQWLDEFLREHAQIAPRLGFTLDAAALAGDLIAGRYVIGQIGRRGCRFMLDDLGVSGAGLELLRFQHVEYLGLRGDLVHQVAHDSAAFETVLGLCRITAACNIATVAREVDDAALAATLGRMGVNYVLGAATQALRK